MSIRLDAALDLLLQTPSAGSDPVTMMGWFYIVNDRDAAGVIFELVNGDGTAWENLALSGTDGTTLLITTQNGYTAVQALTVGTWYHLAYVRNGSTHSAYVNGGTPVTRTDGNALTASNTVIGSSSIDWCDARFSDMRVFSAALTQSEIIAEMRSPVAVRSSNLFADWQTPSGAGRLNDSSGYSRNLTCPYGAVADEADPPYAFSFTASDSGSLSEESSLISGVGIDSGTLVIETATITTSTIYTQNNTGAITPSGALAKLDRKTISGGLTPSGIVRRLLSTTKTGAVTPSGSLANLRTVYRTLTGAIAPAGALSKQTARTITGNITPTGAAIKLTIRTLTGSLVPAGSIANIRAYVRLFAGSLTPSGALTRQANKGLTGTIAPIGTVARAINKTFAGSITPSGAVANIRAFVRLFTGSLTPSGTLARQPAKALAGSITPSGNLIRLVGGLKSGSVAPGGSLAKLTSKVAFTGSLTPSGALAVVKVIVRLFTGSIAPAGTLIKEVSKTMTGALAPAGSLGKLISKLFQGLIAPFGDAANSGGSTPPTVTPNIDDYGRRWVVSPDGSMSNDIKINW